MDPLSPLTPAEAALYLQQLTDAYLQAELQILVTLSQRGGQLTEWPDAFAKSQLAIIQEALERLRAAQMEWFGTIVPAVYEHGLAVVDTRMMLAQDLPGYMGLRRGGVSHWDAVGRVNAVRGVPSTQEFQSLIAKGDTAEKAIIRLREEHPGAVFGSNRLAGHQEITAVRAIAPPVSVEEAERQADEAKAAQAEERQAAAEEAQALAEVRAEAERAAEQRTEEAAAAPPPERPKPKPAKDQLRIVTPVDDDYRQINQRVLNNLSTARSHPLNSQVYKLNEKFSWHAWHREANLRIAQDALKAGKTTQELRKQLLEEYGGRTLTAEESANFRKALANRKVAPTQAELDALREGGQWVYVDKSGRRWNPRDYADMVARTTIREAEELAVDQEQIGMGEDLIEVSDHQRECWQCKPWERVVLSITGATEGYITKAEAKAHGLWHPRCAHKSLPLIVGLSIQPQELTADDRRAQLAVVLDLRKKAKQEYLEGEKAA